MQALPLPPGDTPNQPNDSLYMDLASTFVLELFALGLDLTVLDPAAMLDRVVMV
jgi:hypothetical protein